MSPAGAVLDPDGIPISTAADDQTQPAVAFDGTNYLVAWQDAARAARMTFTARASLPAERCSTRPGSRSRPWPTKFHEPARRRLRRDELPRRLGGRALRRRRHLRSRASARPGRCSTRAGIPISTATDRQDAPAIAFDGTNYLVVWTTSAPARPTPTSTAHASARPARSSTRPESRSRPRRRPRHADARLRRHELSRRLAGLRARHGHLRRAVTPAGKVLEPDGIIVSTAVNSLVHPRSPSTARTFSSSGRTTG